MQDTQNFSPQAKKRTRQPSDCDCQIYTGQRVRFMKCFSMTLSVKAKRSRPQNGRLLKPCQGFVWCCGHAALDSLVLVVPVEQLCVRYSWTAAAMLRQLRLRARGQGLGTGAGLTQAGAQATHGAKQSTRRPVASAAREARTGAVLSQHAHAEALSRQFREDEVGPLHVYAPSMEEASTSGSSTDDEFLENNAVPATSLAVEPEGKGLSASVSSSEILGPVVADMQQLTVNLRSVVGERHPMLMAAAEQIFGAGGKKLRPAIVFLVARATCELAGLRCASALRRLLTARILQCCSAVVACKRRPCCLLLSGAGPRAQEHHREA